MKRLYVNGTILTMEDEISKEAMLCENGRILAVGKRNEIEPSNENVNIIDLDGKTMMPAFIDAHSHLTSYANSFLQVNLEECVSFEDIMIHLQTFAKRNQIVNGGWINASGYDHNSLVEKQHPTKDILDEAFPDIAVVLQHKSRHFGVFNTTALKTLRFQGKDSNGYLEENAFIAALKQIPMPKPQDMIAAYDKAQSAYASYGITTIQEGMMVAQMLPLYQMLLSGHYLKLDVVGFPQISDADLFYNELPEYAFGYKDNFRLGGYKIILDGSPQGRTAFMKTSYIGTEEYGISTMSEEEVKDALDKAVHDHRQILAHCNGDAAAEQFLNAAEIISYKEELTNIKPVMIHAQFLEREQLPRVKKLGIIPSFFTAHSYFWGDTHITNLGFERAKYLSPSKTALSLGIPFTFHQDTPVIAPDMLKTVWCAVNRKTKKGISLGVEEKISVFDALKAVTINAAFQYSEENRRGTFTAGKEENIVVLDQNPLSVSEENIDQIQVLQTICKGECVYCK